MNYNAHFKKKIHIFNDSLVYTHRFIMAMCVFLGHTCTVWLYFKKCIEALFNKKLNKSLPLP